MALSNTHDLHPPRAHWRSLAGAVLALLALAPLGIATHVAPNRATGVDAFVGGGDGNTASGELAGVVGGLRNQAGGFTAFVGGGEANHGAGDFGHVGGGFANTAEGQGASVSGGWDNHATVSRASVSGGEGNTATGPGAAVAGGFRNVAIAYGDAVGGGELNAASGGLSVVAGGRGNLAVGTKSAVLGGQDNAARGDFSAIPGGLKAVTRSVGQLAHASGAFYAEGDAQASSYVARALVSGADVPLRLGPDGTDPLVIPPNSAWAVDALVVARSDTAAAGWKVSGVVLRGPSGTVWVGSPSVTSLGADPAAMMWSVRAETDANAPVRLVASTGPPPAIGKPPIVQFVASIRTAEVTL